MKKVIGKLPDSKEHTHNQAHPHAPLISEGEKESASGATVPEEKEPEKEILQHAEPERVAPSLDYSKIVAQRRGVVHEDDKKQKEINQEEIARAANRIGPSIYTNQTNISSPKTTSGESSLNLQA